MVACEDTRVSGPFLVRHGISATLVAYHEHNAGRVRPYLMERMKRGESVALVSDAGTPLVSDPGFRLVAACHQAGVPVTAIPGPSAVLAALVVAGLPTDRFLYIGFPPTRSAARRRMLAEVATVPATIVALESPRRLAASLTDMAAVLGDRPAAVARELTKKFEETRRGLLSELARHYAEAGPPKGEVTVVVGPPGPPAAPTEDAVDRLLDMALREGSVRDAADRVAAATGLKRRDVYARAIARNRRP